MLNGAKHKKEKETNKIVVVCLWKHRHSNFFLQETSTTAAMGIYEKITT